MKNLTLHIADMITDFLADFVSGNDYSDHQTKLKFAQSIIDEVRESDKEAWEARNDR